MTEHDAIIRAAATLLHALRGVPTELMLLQMMPVVVAANELQSAFWSGSYCPDCGSPESGWSGAQSVPHCGNECGYVRPKEPQPVCELKKESTFQPTLKPTQHPRNRGGIGAMIVEAADYERMQRAVALLEKLNLPPDTVPDKAELGWVGWNSGVTVGELRAALERPAPLKEAK